VRALVTGAAGFIGNALTRGLLARGDEVVGVDDLNDYYDVGLKRDRLALCADSPSFRLHELDVADAPALAALADDGPFDVIVHLAAQAGVRYSIENPGAYVRSNLVGFANVLELARATRVPHLVYSSSSSVYGLSPNVPFREVDTASHPASLYAATKRANELMAHSYAHNFAIPCTGLRFFTVYGPWGRPDMALFTFARGILDGTPIQLFNEGRMSRDFTFIEDLVRAVLPVLERAPSPDPDWDGQDPSRSSAPFRVVNVGGGNPVPLERYVRALEQALGSTAVVEKVAMPPGDIPRTEADPAQLAALSGVVPTTSVEDGVAAFVEWYRDYYGER
jgi:UDP-glucuronate 4-epimerase